MQRGVYWTVVSIKKLYHRRATVKTSSIQSLKMTKRKRKKLLSSVGWKFWSSLSRRTEGLKMKTAESPGPTVLEGHSQGGSFIPLTPAHNPLHELPAHSWTWQLTSPQAGDPGCRQKREVRCLSHSSL